MAKRPSDEVRAECYQRLRDVLSSDMHGYFQQHPERINEERTRIGLQLVLLMLEKMLTVLEDYEICDREPQ